MSTDFPDDLVQAQRDLNQVTAQLHAAYAELPWSAAPEAGWQREDRQPSVSFPDSPGWTDEQKQQIEELRARRLQLAETIVTHEYWATHSGADAVAARTALKHIDDPAED